MVATQGKVTCRDAASVFRTQKHGFVSCPEPTSLPSALAASTSLLTSFCTVCAPTFSRDHSGCHVLLAKMRRASSSAERNRVGSDLGDARTDCAAVSVVFPAARRRVVEEAKLSRKSRNPAVRTSGVLEALSRAVRRSCHLGVEAVNDQRSEMGHPERMQSIPARARNCAHAPRMDVPVHDWAVQSLFEFCVCDDALLLNQAGDMTSCRGHGVILRELVSEHVLDQSGRHALQLQSPPALESEYSVEPSTLELVDQIRFRGASA